MASNTSRRNGASTSKPMSSKSPPSFSTSPNAQASSSALSSPRPYLLEFLLLALYPSLLLLGSLFSLLDPTARAAPYSAVSQSHPPEFAPSYFALKRNSFNTYFVKIGWFWFTLAWAIWIFISPSMVVRKTARRKEDGEGDDEDAGFVVTPRRLQAGLRWVLVTGWWVLVTQWCIGPPIIDRGFRITGGQCELLRSEAGREEMGEVREALTAAACKLAGGQWKGGHDISGHVFLLVLGGAAMGLEILGGLSNQEVEGQRGRINKWGSGVVMGVMGLSWWMLLMTAAYFHVWFEKVSDILSGIWLVEC